MAMAANPSAEPRFEPVRVSVPPAEPEPEDDGRPPPDEFDPEPTPVIGAGVLVGVVLGVVVVVVVVVDVVSPPRTTAERAWHPRPPSSSRPHTSMAKVPEVP